MSKDQFLQRKLRTKAKIQRFKDRPRLSVFRSNKYLYAQIVDDLAGKTLVAVASSDKDLTKENLKPIDLAFKVGEALAKKALAKKVKLIRFDKGGYKYHGLVKALADGARKGGLEF